MADFTINSLATGTVASTDNFIKSDTNGVLTKVPASELLDKALFSSSDFANPGFHNSIYRGKNLGSSITAEQWSAIGAGSFDDMFIGDYWTITYGGTTRNFRIAGFDYWLGCGDKDWNDGNGNYNVPRNSTHHVVIVPDTSLASAKMNNTDTTDDAYVGSDFYTGSNSNTGKASAIAIVEGSFGSSHILNHRDYFATTVTSGYESAGDWCDSTIDLMNEQMVYGAQIFHNKICGTNRPYNMTVGKGQLPLFAIFHRHIHNGDNYWLRDVATASSYCCVASTGFANSTTASKSYGIRPAFGIRA